MSSDAGASQALLSPGSDEGLALPYADEIFSLTGVKTRARKAGERVPDFAVLDGSGQRIDLAERWREDSLVIVFLRGGQCGSCNLQLRRWRPHLARLAQMGASFVALTPQAPQDFAAEFDGEPSDIAIYSDNDGEAVAAFELSVYVPPELVDLIAASGLDAPVLGADGQWRMPIPAVYVVGKCGRIRFAHIDDDPHRPIDPDMVMAAMERDGVAMNAQRCEGEAPALVVRMAP